MLFALNDGIAGVLATRNLGEKSNLMWILDDPARALMGIAFSFKALWIMVVGAVIYLLSKRKTKDQVLRKNRIIIVNEFQCFVNV